MNKSYPKKNKLIAFDMDSTLIQCEVIDEIARFNKVYDEVAGITYSAMNGEIDFNESFRKRVALLEGTHISFLEEFAASLPFSEGLDLLVDYLKSEHYRIVILSGGFNFFAERICNHYHFDHFKSNQLEIKNGKLTGRVFGEIINADKKAYYFKKYVKDYHINKVLTAAVGDGANDLKMLQTSHCGIAYCAKKVVQDEARFHINDKNISKLIPILEEYVQ